MLRYALRWIVALPVLLLYLYGAAGMIGGLIPVNTGRATPTEGIRIYVEDNGIHTGIVLPAEGWEDIVRPDHFADPRYAGHRWRSFGWGDRAFYIGTPTWWDVNPLTVLRSATGSDDTVIHVDAIPEPQVGPRVRMVVVTPAEFARLTAFIRASFAPGAPVRGYGAYDAFYPATGRYSAARTCNAWTGEALRHAGLKMGRWTPFPATVMTWLN
ncbi:TIGR02117 family protein [Sphingomonas donggukensis]|uniref:TIGR02117 family protein n=1 Tax=Sphingomonas donggukensis TaxID=2949093 RepID=A0ABY4TYQ5_9SPHN|nr:TIGR02117 family protein [Sphingomonas donggukensis]URW75681.1 TIGR02117 family protein [Sphingomonas donggukensis]